MLAEGDQNIDGNAPRLVPASRNRPNLCINTHATNQLLQRLERLRTKQEAAKQQRPWPAAPLRKDGSYNNSTIYAVVVYNAIRRLGPRIANPNEYAEREHAGPADQDDVLFSLPDGFMLECVAV